ncbi:hypothetical protein [Salinicoccus sp. Marseille-QA3877]
MILSNFAIDSFNNHKPYFYLLIIESNNINIYQNYNKTLILSRSSDVQYQMLKVHEINQSEESISFKVELPNDENGIITPVDSVLLIPKIREQVKIDSDTTLKNELNNHFDIDYDYFEENRNKVVYSNQYVVFNNKLYEALILVDEIIGFIQSDHINRMHACKSDFKIIKDTTVHKNSGMTQPYKLFKASEKLYKSMYIMPSESKIRFKHGNNSLWIDKHATDFKEVIREKNFKDINEVVLDSILFQYQLQVENYHTYYCKIIKEELRRS